MSDRDSTASPAPDKPAKPYPDFPLFAHAAGYWAKKIRGKLHYFGPWADPDAALAKYLDQKDALHAGRVPRPGPEAVTVKDVVNAFLNHKRTLLDTGELSQWTWRDYKIACDLLVSRFGKNRLAADLSAADFAALRTRMAARWGPHRLGTTIQCIRCVFRHAYESELMDKPVRYGPGFDRPTKKTFRLHRAKQGPKLFAADEIHRLLAEAGPPLRAMILLGINCGFGNTDCGTLPRSAVDLDEGWVRFPRPKTGIERRCPLWPETVAAVREALAHRPEPKKEEHAGLVFVTTHGGAWARDNDSGVVSKEMRKLLNATGINGRKGLGFYTLRHTF